MHPDRREERRTARQRRGRQARRSGRWAEALAVWRLRCAGYRILARNWRSPVGEIDVVARKGAILAIVEVKSRLDLSNALAALGPRQQARLTRAALAFQSQRHDCAGLMLRFDVIAVGAGRVPPHLGVTRPGVTWDGWRQLWPQHIKQAWHPQPD